MLPFLMIVGLLSLGQVPAVPAKPAVDLRCGSYCLFVSLKALDRPVGAYDDFQKSLGSPSQMGYSMQQLATTAQAYNAYALGVETSLENLEARRGRFACIALLENDKHFVCVYDISSDVVSIVDPPVERKVSRDAFTSLWQGKALLISDSPITPDRRFKSRYLLISASSVIGILLASLILASIRRRIKS